MTRLIEPRPANGDQAKAPNGRGKGNPLGRSVHGAGPGRPSASVAQEAGVLGRLAALKSASIVDLKAEWRALFDAEPPPYNRKFLESRLAYRIQELAYGGLKPATVERLAALADAVGSKGSARRADHERRPIAGTRLIREWRGVEHCVTVRDEDFEYQGRPYKSLSAIARSITGSRWNGWVFFGLKSQRGQS